MHPIALEFQQELIQSEHHRQEGDLARELAEVHPPILIGAAPEDVLDVDHANDRRQVVLAERESRVTGLPGDPQVVFHRAGQAQVDDVRPRDHHPTRRLLFQVQDVFDHHPLVAREVAAGHALGDDQPQLFLGMGQLGVAGAAQAEDPERQVARLVQDPDHRREDVREDHQRRGSDQRQDLGLADRQGLGRLLAQRHVEERHQRQRGHRDGPDGHAEDHDFGGGDLQGGEHVPARLAIVMPICEADR